MAVSAATVWEVRTTGASTNGGGFVTGATGTDYSQYDTAQWPLLAVTSLGATNVMTTASAAATMVGNILYDVSGTNAIVGWFEIISVNVGVDITLDRNWCTGACNNGVVNIGGAWSIGSSLDDDFFETVVAGNKIWIKNGSHTLGEIMASSIAGAATTPIVVEGYKTNRGDRPQGTDQPLITADSTYYFGIGNSWELHCVRFTGTTSATQLVLTGSSCKVVNCKATNMYTGAAEKSAFLTGGTTALYGCEAVSLRGRAFNISSTNKIYGCYAHDSKVGILSNGNNNSIIGCVVDTALGGIAYGANSGQMIIGNTIRNCSTGINGTTATAVMALNNIIADCELGADASADQPLNIWDYNCWSNNTADTTFVTQGSNDVTADALLGSAIAEGTDGATDAGGTVFTAASNPFGSVTTSDCLYIFEAGTGATVGVYNISSVDGAGQITLARSAGASKTGIDYRIVEGTDFTLGAGSPALNVGIDAATFCGVTV